MAEAISQSLAMAIGVAISPIPVIAVVLTLTTPLARANGSTGQRRRPDPCRLSGVPPPRGRRPNVG